LNQTEKRFDRLIAFLQTFRICQGIQRSVLQQLSYYLKEKVVRRRDRGFKEGEQANGMYFIVDGEFEVTKTLDENC
jgi:CRP-like cAMP-binding protein